MSEGELERKISYVLVNEDLQNVDDLELLESDLVENKDKKPKKKGFGFRDKIKSIKDKR